MKTLTSPRKNIPPRCSPRWKHSGHTQKHHTKIRKTTKGDFEGNLKTTIRRHFHNVGRDMFLIVFDTFIKTDPFGSLTKNDATVGTKLFGPTKDLFCGIIVCF